jgi:hypothetical protein
VKGAIYRSVGRVREAVEGWGDTQGWQQWEAVILPRPEVGDTTLVKPEGRTREKVVCVLAGSQGMRSVVPEGSKQSVWGHVESPHSWQPGSCNTRQLFSFLAHSERDQPASQSVLTSPQHGSCYKESMSQAWWYNLSTWEVDAGGL